MNTLVAFWNEAALHEAPFQHPKDVIPGRQIESEIACYADFIRAFEEGKLSRKALHLGLLPQPFLGDLDNAEIILLLRNPGLSACDYYAEERHPAYRHELIAAIRQERRQHVFLDTRWAWTSGFIWWESKLREVTRLIAAERFDGHYGRALRDLAGRLASIEMMPYHSFDYGGVKRLVSAEAARRFVASLDGDRTVIVTRGVADWALPPAPHIIRYPSSHARSASLGPTTAGGRAILARYGISLPTTL